MCIGGGARGIFTAHPGLCREPLSAGELVFRILPRPELWGCPPRPGLPALASLSGIPHGLLTAVLGSSGLGPEASSPAWPPPPATPLLHRGAVGTSGFLRGCFPHFWKPTAVWFSVVKALAGAQPSGRLVAGRGLSQGDSY